jgi:hypothetical protein
MFFTSGERLIIEANRDSQISKESVFENTNIITVGYILFIVSIN